MSLPNAASRYGQDWSTTLFGNKSVLVSVERAIQLALTPDDIRRESSENLAFDRLTRADVDQLRELLSARGGGAKGFAHA